MRILIITPYIGDAYGTEKVVQQSSELLQKAGHEIHIITGIVHGHWTQPTAPLVRPELFSVRYLSPRSEISPLTAELLKIIGSIRPDIVHLSELIHSRLLSAVCAKYPTVLTSHLLSTTCPASTRLLPPRDVCNKSSGWKCLWHHQHYHCLGAFRNNLIRMVVIADYKAKRQAAKNLVGVAAVSRFVEQKLLEDGWDPKKVFYVPNPIESFEISEYNRSKIPCLITASRLEPIKGLPVLIEALSELKGLDWQLEIYGEGSEKQNLQNHSQKHGLSNRIFFRGKISEIELRDRLRSAYCLIQPNWGPETFGMSVAGAMALGTPVIAADVPAINELIPDGTTGWLFSVGSVSDLSQKIRWLLENPDSRATVINTARDHIRHHYSPSQHLEATLRMYHTCLD